MHPPAAEVALDVDRDFESLQGGPDPFDIELSHRRKFLPGRRGQVVDVRLGKSCCGIQFFE